MVLHILLFISITFPFVIAGSPDTKSETVTKYTDYVIARSEATKQSFLLRVPLNTLELRERQQEALKAIISPIDAHLESNERAVTGITYMKDGESIVTLLNPAPEFDFALVKRIRDRLAEDGAGNIVGKGEDLYNQVMEVKGFLGLYEKETSIPELIDIAKDTNDKRGTSALVALELKGAMFRTSESIVPPDEEVYSELADWIVANSYSLTRQTVFKQLKRGEFIFQAEQSKKSDLSYVPDEQETVTIDLIAGTMVKIRREKRFSSPYGNESPPFGHAGHYWGGR